MNENKAKDNKIPSEETIKKLEERNYRLLDKVKQKKMSDKNTDELQLSIDNGLVKKFWIGFQG